MAIRPELSRPLVLAGSLALGAGLLVGAPRAALALDDGPPEVSRLIVAYERGVAAVRPDGEATGSGSVPGIELAPGDPIGKGMRTVELEEAVSEAAAEQIAERLEQDPRIAWAEPDVFIEMLEDLPVRDPDEPQPPKDEDTLQRVTTACAESTSVEPIARCYDDDNLDAGWSLDAEIIWADAYVTAADASTLVVDIVPYVATRDDNWLLNNDTDISVEVDLDSDDVADLSMRPVPAALTVGQSTPITIYDYGTASTLGSACSGVLTRKSGIHREFPGAPYSWWEFSVNWSCLVGAESANVRLQARAVDYLWPGGDLAPDSFDDQVPIDFGVLGSDPPDAPNSVAATPAPAALDVTWSAPAAPPTPGNYTVRAYDDSIGGTQLATCTSLSTSCTLDELDPATTYWIDVTASNHIGDSPASAPRISASPGPAEAPGAPQTVQARTSSQQVRLSWTAPASDGGSAVTGYTAELYSSPSGGTPAATCSTAGLTCTITGLTNAVTYYASVVATNDVGPGAGSTRFAVTPRLEYQPDDPYYTSNQMWGLSGDWGINAPSAWAMTQGSPDVVVAVLDTGGTDHPDLLDQTVAGYDMIESLSTANDGDGRDPNPADPGDWSSSRRSSWHGTHVAGTINAIGNNATGVVGVAPEVKVQHVRVLGTGGGWTSDIAAGITWASGGLVSGLPLNATPARVINMSLGGSGSCGTAMQTAINGARTAGTAVVVAAGNSNSDAAGFSPANCSGVVTVAATTSSGARASFSNYGSTVEIAAPGSGIWSTLNTGSTSPASPTYASYSGTSMASPHVAGVVALMMSRSPTLTPAQVDALITDPANASSFPGGVCDASTPSKTCGAGLINASSLLQAVRAPTAITSFTPSAGPASGGASVVITGEGFTGASAVTFGPDAATSFTVDSDTQITAVAPARDAGSVAITVTTSENAAVSVGSFEYQATVPDAPTAVLAAPLSGSAQVTWSAPDYTGGVPLTGYTVTASPDGATCTTTEDLFCTVSGLTDDSTYTFTVVASNAAGDSDPSSASDPVTPSASASIATSEAPGAVTAARAAASAVITWQAPADSGSFPVIGYRAVATPGSAACRVEAPALTCTITGLVNGATYDIGVDALTGAGWGSVATTSVTPAAAPGAPAAPTLQAGNGEIGVTWSASADTGGLALTGYSVQVATSSGGPFSAASGTCASPGLDTSCTATGLANGTTYYLRVAGINDAGTGSYSSASSAAPVAPAPPPAPPGGGGDGGGGGGGAPAPAPAPSESASPSPSPSPSESASPSPSPTPSESPSPVPAPDLPPGEAAGLVGGEPDPNLTTYTSGNALVLSGTGYALSFGATDVDGMGQQLGEGGVLTVATGGGVSVGGTGFAPSGYVDVFLDPPSTGALAYALARLLPRSSFSLGRVVVDADGSISGSIDIPADAPVGERVLQIVGRTGDDRSLVLSLGIEVAAPEQRTIMITATRGVGRKKQFVRVQGETTGLAGREVSLRMWSGGRAGYVSHPKQPVVRSDDTFRWSVRMPKRVRIFATVMVGGERVRSNPVVVRAVR